MSLGEAAAARVERTLYAYVDALLDAFSQVAGRLGGLDVVRDVGGRAVRFRIAGERLVAAIWPALAHLPEIAEGIATELEIVAWDEHEAGVGRPPTPWREPPPGQVCQQVLPAGGEDFRIPGGGDPTAWIFACRSRRLNFWIKHDDRPLETHHRAAPFLLLFHWWAEELGLRLLHAGCIGSEAGAVLLVGRGGAGKSTTALLCAAGGLDYLSDDYCLVRTSGTPEAFALYGTGKLHREHLARFPELAARAVDPGPDIFRKPVIFLTQAWPERVVSRRRLLAVVATQVVGVGPTRSARIGPAEALRALGPSTLFQLPGGASPQAWAELASLVRRLPCHRLELGGDVADVAPMVRRLIEEVG